MWACVNFQTKRFCPWATRQWRSHQNTHKTFLSKLFSFKWFLCFYFWAVIWAILLTCSLVCMSLRQLARTLLKLASSARAVKTLWRHLKVEVNFCYSPVGRISCSLTFHWHPVIILCIHCYPKSYLSLRCRSRGTTLDTWATEKKVQRQTRTKTSTRFNWTNQTWPDDEG